MKYEMKKIIKGALLTAALMTTLVACGNRNNSTTQPPVNAFTASCTNCQNITGFPFFTAQTQVYSFGYGYGFYGQAVATLNWSFSGQNTSSSTAQNSNPYASPAMNYVGQASVAGQLDVTQNLGTNNFCPAIPSGSYSIATQTVGQWANGQISGMRFLINGTGVSAVAVLNQAQASEYTYGYGYYSGGGGSASRVTGTLIIESVNGYYCQGLQLNLY